MMLIGQSSKVVWVLDCFIFMMLHDRFSFQNLTKSMLYLFGTSWAPLAHLWSISNWTIKKWAGYRSIRIPIHLYKVLLIISLLLYDFLRVGRQSLKRFTQYNIVNVKQKIVKMNSKNNKNENKCNFVTIPRNQIPYFYR